MELNLSSLNMCYLDVDTPNRACLFEETGKGAPHVHTEIRVWVVSLETHTHAPSRADLVTHCKTRCGTQHTHTDTLACLYSWCTSGFLTTSWKVSSTLGNYFCVCVCSKYLSLFYLYTQSVLYILGETSQLCNGSSVLVYIPKKWLNTPLRLLWDISFTHWQNGQILPTGTWK